VKLIVLADDLTGALDTGIQFVAGKANTRVVLDPTYPLASVDAKVQVLVVDTESRHLPPQKAAGLVAHIVKQAAELHVPYIYKKTDSALRGNIGAELAAALKASGARQLHFVPAFPKTKRSTENGIQLIDGTPVAKSVFAKDPFNPVKHSAVAEILAEQTDVKILNKKKGEGLAAEPGIIVYDAVTDEDILAWTQKLHAAGTMKVMAGCAGFATAVPKVIDLSGASQVKPQSTSAFFVACGSVNPITVAQLQEAEEHGFKRYYFGIEQLLAKDFSTSAAVGQMVEIIATALKKGQNCILDTNTKPGEKSAEAYAKEHGLNMVEIGKIIASHMGLAIKKLLQTKPDATMLITGGDTLMGFMQAEHISEIVPVKEVSTGSVLSLITVGGQTYNIISKSGGFGNKTLLTDLVKVVVTKA